MSLVPIADNVWGVEDTRRMPGGVYLPLRSTVVRLQTGKVVLISPVPLDEDTATEIDALGEVEALVAPNLFHHLYLRPAKERFPGARVLGPVGLAKKRRNLTLEEIGPNAPALWPDDLEQHLVDGAPRISELAFYHVPSRTLIVCDLVFNVQRPRGWATRLLLSLMGTNGRFAVSRLTRLYSDDLAAVRRSAQHLLARGVDRVVMGHGEVLERDVEAELTRAFAAI